MRNLRFIWWVVIAKRMKNFDTYLSLSNKEKEQLWIEFDSLN